MSRSDRGDRERWHGEAVTDEGAMIERFFVGPDALIGPLDGSFRRGISPPAGGELLCPWRLVVAKSTRLRFRLAAKTALVPLLFLFPANPLRWASPGGTREITQNAAGDAADGLRLRFAPPRSIGLPPYPLCRYATSPPDRGSRPRTPLRGLPLGAGRILPARKI